MKVKKLWFIHELTSNDTSKTAKITKRWYYSAAHWHFGDVLVGNITFLWFLHFLDVSFAINSCINCSFFTFIYSHSMRSGMDDADLPANYTMSAFTSYAFTRWHLPKLRLRTHNCSLLLIYLPQKDERLSQPGWLTYSGQFTHISGHPSAVGRAQDRESSPVKDRRSTTVPCNQAWLTTRIHTYQSYIQVNLLWDTIIVNYFNY